MANQPVPNPCTRECPKRGMLCQSDCPEWAEYVVLRDAEYKRRKKESEKKSAEYGYSAALRKKINRRCR